jgi:hypothetical protein
MRIFGERLVPPPRALAAPDRRIATDRLFDETEHTGLLEPPRRRAFDDNDENWG